MPVARRPIVVGAMALAGVVAVCVALVQLRNGIVPLLDTVTYWSGAEAVADGHVFRTTLAPSFSNFDAVEFLARSGELPFVDFPVAYPLLAGGLGVVIGTRAAMHLLTVAAVALISAGIVAGSPRRSTYGLALATAFACLVPVLPSMRLVTQGALSEPLFIASCVLFVIALARFRRGGSWWPVVVFVIVGSLLRFLGAPLAVLAGWEHARRHGDSRRHRSVLWTLAMVAPAGANIVAAAAAGGGHDAGWRGLDRMDIEIFVRSIGGWFDASQGDIRRTYFTTDGPSWWSWPVAVLAVGLVALTAIAVLRRRTLLGDEADLALCSAGILSIGLFAGILGFDALVIADNRLMLPAGILVLCAVVWTVAGRARSLTAQSMAIALGLVIWTVCAVRPWNLTERFSDIDRPLAMSVTALESEAAIVISNDADGVHWDTGIPSAYTPSSIKPLTGQTVDDRPIYRQLPCALLRAGGVVIISNETTFSTVNREALEESTSDGRLRRIEDDRTRMYLPTPAACDE